MPPPGKSNHRRAPKNPYIDRRESKNQEIKRALVHRARLRKNYFKELEKEGEQIPEKQENSSPMPRNEKDRLDYKQRSTLVKQRKDAARRERLEQREGKKKELEQREAQRSKKRESLSQKTRSGQPLMAPRIENLLEKIKKDYA